jgi:hypothetical protein
VLTFRTAIGPETSVLSLYAILRPRRAKPKISYSALECDASVPCLKRRYYFYLFLCCFSEHIQCWNFIIWGVKACDVICEYRVASVRYAPFNRSVRASSNSSHQMAILPAALHAICILSPQPPTPAAATSL